MESGEIRMRFGRCPYCRTMIYQNPEAVIFFCTKCRTPIRGKNPVPTEEIDQALSKLEILSVDTASVFSDEHELDACHNKLSPGVDIDGDQPSLFHQDSAPLRSSSSPAPDGGFGSVRRGHSLSNGAPTSARYRDDGFVVDSIEEQDKLLRPFSRRTRRPSGSDPSVLRYGTLMTTTTDSETEEWFSSPRNACERQRRRQPRSLLGSQASSSLMSDPAFSNELVNALDDLRGLIAAAMGPGSSSRRASASAPRDGHLFRRLESQLARALQLRTDDGLGHRRNASSTSGSSSSSSSSSSGGYRRERQRKSHCRPILGGAPFLVCGGCSELLQAPAAATMGLGLMPRGKAAVRLRCGACQEVLDLTPPAVPSHSVEVAVAAADLGSCNGGECGDGDGVQRLPPQPLHRALGYSSPSPLLQSRRY